MQEFDIIIIGAGASGMFAAGRAMRAKKSVCILDMGLTPARRVAVSGGGKCNFTNAHADTSHYFGENPNFTRSALTRFTPADAVNWVKSHKIPIHEKTPGQFFADDAQHIVDALLSDAHGAKIFQNTTVTAIEKPGDKFIVTTAARKKFTSTKLIVATGGMSYAPLGVSDIGYKIAKQFGHKIIPPRPALCGIKAKIFDTTLAGISAPVEITIGREKIRDDMLFTHFGIGGPAIYRATVRDCAKGFTINLMPGINAYDWLREQKNKNARKQLKTILATKLPNKLAEFLTHDTRNIADIRDIELKQFAFHIQNIKLNHDDFSLFGFAGAEVTRGGVSTTQISSKTMESKLCPGLYFIGESLDIAGDLGGYNLHWAWASANAVEI
ncbi:MAG: aminoacetone oxidase family FAD-binding enzyme [Alphaproteobacteria bacterium]|nr:aminoacetone oxidase family FAD-binding enzyme [Alphaproteobacteria bacterium]